MANVESHVNFTGDCYCAGIERPYVDPTNLSGGTLDTLVDIIDVLRSMT